MMDKTDWNAHVEYLRESRKAWLNTDYIDFLIKSVWKISKPVAIADFACGLGYLGSVMLPCLPEESTYTGFDNAGRLLAEAENIFAGSGYHATFVHRDLETEDVPMDYDLVMCQAFLMHLPEPERMLQKMVDAVKPGGLVICIDTNWNVGNAAMYIDGLDLDANCNLGLLAKLWKTERARFGRDRCIGMKLPVLMQKLGLHNVGIRMNDCVRFINPHSDPDEYQRQLDTFRADGWGREMGDEDEYVKVLCRRGLTEEEAHRQYAIEKEINEYVRVQGDRLTALTIPPMFISYGTK